MTMIALKLRRKHSYRKSVPAASADEADFHADEALLDAHGQPITPAAFLAAGHTLVDGYRVSADEKQMQRRSWWKGGTQHVSEYASADGKYALAIEHASIGESEAAPPEIGIDI